MLTKEKEAPVLDLRPSSSGWGLPVLYQKPPRYLAVSLAVAFVGLTAIGPSISIEALAGLLRQVMTIARTVHLAEQLRDPPAPQVAAPPLPAPSPEWVLQSDGSYKLRREPAQTTHTASGITYHDHAPAPEPSRAADPDHAARVRQNIAVSDYLAADSRSHQVASEARQYVAHDPALRTLPELQRLWAQLAEAGREQQAAAERLLNTPDIADVAAVDGAREFLRSYTPLPATMPKCVPDRATMLRGGQ